MEKKRETNGKLKAFLKKNVYYIIMGICLIAIAAMVTVALVYNSDSDVDPEQPVGPSQDINNPPASDIGDDEPGTNVDITDPDPVVPVVPAPVAVVFTSPVNDINIIRDYSMDAVVWNSTLKHYAVHKGIDFAGNDGDSVMSAYSGTISEITYDVLNGYTVKIKHNDKLTTTYSSLNEPSVVVGQTVAKGEVIGTMGVTATNECLDGAHLHFCLYEDGKIASPYNYLSIGDK